MAVLSEIKKFRPKRSDRLGAIVRKELCQIFLRSSQDPRLVGMTVTSVQISPDLSHATVRISFLQIDLDEAALRDRFAALKGATGFFRSELAKRLGVRVLPTLSFEQDKDAVKISECCDLLCQVK